MSAASKHLYLTSVFLPKFPGFKSRLGAHVLHPIPVYIADRHFVLKYCGIFNSSLFIIQSTLQNYLWVEALKAQGDCLFSTDYGTFGMFNVSLV